MTRTPGLETGTWVTTASGRPNALRLRRFTLEIVSGPDKGATHTFDTGTARIGALPTCDVTLSDPKVSGHHAEIRLAQDGYRVRDLESTNGTYIGGVRLLEGFVRPGQIITIGTTELRFTPLTESVEIGLEEADRCHGLVGQSVAMRHLYRVIHRVADTDAAVLITGETGVGKELCAEAVHRSSHRKDGPLVVVDCGAIPGNLFENELFGHERGAYTGADSQMIGAFERAHGGTLFLDEIGELTLDLQPKLLRALQNKVIRRVGGSEDIECDVRVIAATNRDLAVEVNRGTFRADLYYRLCVAHLEVPPLRARLDDVPLLVDHFLARAGETASLPTSVREELCRHSWPGNVRELANAVERATIVPDSFRADDTGVVDAGPAVRVDISRPYKPSRQELVDRFDRAYLSAVLEEHKWNISAVARTAGLDRMTIYKMLDRLGIERPK